MRWETLRRTDPSADTLPLDLDDLPAASDAVRPRAGLRDPGRGPIESGASEPIAVELHARSILNKVPSTSCVPFRWTINAYRGCSHACRYCFARQTHTYLDLDAGNDFDSTILVKVNAAELLRAELSSPKWTGEPVAMGTNTDPYQRAEGRYGLTRALITVLTEFGNPFSILTKGTLILRDLDLIVRAARKMPVSVAVSVGSVDEQLWRTVEPGAPSPRRRLEVVRRFADAGVECSVLMAPVLPGLSDSDEHLEATVASIAAAGAVDVTALPLHLRPGAREWYLSWLGEEYPELLDRYDELFGDRAYTPAAYGNWINTRVRELAARYRIGHAADAAAHRMKVVPTPPAPTYDQPSLL